MRHLASMTFSLVLMLMLMLMLMLRGCLGWLRRKCCRGLGF